MPMRRPALPIARSLAALPAASRRASNCSPWRAPPRRTTRTKADWCSGCRMRRPSAVHKCRRALPSLPSSPAASAPETALADMTDFFLVLMLPGAGDELQGLKKGIVELADMVAVGFIDRDHVGE